MAKSIPGQLSMWHLMTSEASPSATSSPGSGGGPTPSASPGGPTTGLCGLARAPVSRSRSQGKAPVLTIQGTYGPTFIASSVPSGPLWYWENRLRERLASLGSTEFALIWKEKATPAGALISQLSRSTPRTLGSASTGSPATWPTPVTNEGNETPESWANRNRSMKEKNPLLGALHKKLSTVVQEIPATWPTPTKADGDGGHTMGTASVTGKRENGTKITVSLPGVVKIVSTWPTPTAQPSGTDGESFLRRKGRKPDGAITDLGALVHSGPTTSGLPEQTERPGALNPAFVSWLMGFPPEWDACAPMATPSSRKLRQK